MALISLTRDVLPEHIEQDTAAYPAAVLPISIGIGNQVAHGKLKQTYRIKLMAPRRTIYCSLARHL